MTKDDAMGCARSALVIGGGLAGLTAAASMARAGVECELIEASNEALGSAIYISGRALEGLDELGVLSQCTSEGRIDPLLGAPTPGLGIFRPTLSRILRNRAVQLGAVIELGVSLSGIRQDGDGVIASFNNGITKSYDFAVAADGIGSLSRRLVFGQQYVPEYSGQSVIRWMTPIEIDYPKEIVNTSSGKMFAYSIPGQTYAAAMFAFDEGARLGDTEIRDILRRQLLEVQSVPYIRELLSRLTPETPVLFRQFDWILMPDPWFRGRVLLIGDAAHATTAHLGYGGGMAIEDGVVLGEEIARSLNLDDALRSFMERRFDRVKLVVERSLELCRLEQANADVSVMAKISLAAWDALKAPY